VFINRYRRLIRRTNICHTTTTIGRIPTCDSVIPGTHLSRQQAELTTRGNTGLIRDLASPNGTLINGKRISEAVARAGDNINFDVNFFKLNGPNTDHHKTQVRDGKNQNR
jgi:pSer/pThr/pTyr-binding forkhead associated (FHA) protein